MLRHARLCIKSLVNSNLHLTNDDLFDSAIQLIGTENFLGIDTSFDGSHILYEDPTFPRSTCPGCHGFIRHEDDFCIHCGAPLKETLCPKCGHTERPGAKFCSKCGKRLVEE